MRVLVAIAHHGDKNRPFVERLIDEYSAMSFDVDVVVLAEAAKDLGRDVELLVGLPTPDPWSLPFGHRQLFADRRDRYDLFVYSEDDTLLTEANLRAFLEETERLPPDQIAGFTRFEIAADGRRFLPDSHSGFHWRTDTIEVRDGGLYASYSNEHAACYVLTREHLERCLRSGGYLVPPHQGRYDLLVSAATDPYVTCGLRKVTPVHRIEDFLVHHLPNVYVDKLGIYYEDFGVELDALEKLAACGGSTHLLEPRTQLDTELWDKNFHEPFPPPLESLDVDGATLLSVGVGDGEVERRLIEKGATVYGIPLDRVTRQVAAAKGVIALPPDLDTAIAELEGTPIDRAILLDVLPHLSTPLRALHTVTAGLPTTASLTITTRSPAFEQLRWRVGRRPRPPPPGRFEHTGVHPLGLTVLRRWLRATGYRPTATHRWSGDPTSRSNRLRPALRNAATSEFLLVNADPTTRRSST